MVNKAKNYQTLNNELNETLNQLQDPDVSIGQAIELYEKGQKLIKELEAYLVSAKNKVKLLSKKNSEDEV
jgi:exodeoxyribonuclease VII small subunit